MLTLTKTFVSAGIFVAASLPVAAYAQQAAGTTSGPAAGTNVEPGTATQKRNGNPPGTAAGAPGVAAKKGSESGAKPKESSPQ